MNALHKKHIIIVSTCYIDWGGSEELWAESVPYLLKDGYKIMVYKKTINRRFHRFAKLAALGVTMRDQKSTLSIFSRYAYKGGNFLRRIYLDYKQRPLTGHADPAFQKNICQFRPGLVIISQAINFDGLFLANQCRQLNIPYIIISQKAVDFFWPSVHDRPMMIRTYLAATKCFFVSKHNQQLTEEQMGVRLPNSQVISNPVKNSRRLIAYPKTENGFRLACIARLFLVDKGQDILIRVLAGEKWRNRPLQVSFVGEGEDRNALTEMARLLNVNSIQFVGQLGDVETIWSNHHALILPSRSEGLPLAVIESMANGRVPIVTDAGGTGEAVQDGVTGFIGKADQNSLDDTLERAWQRRSDWEEMGIRAAKYIQETVSENPALDFASQVKKIIND